jgi:hypothetical protein
MQRALPANPNLEHLKKQAKDFLKEFNSGNSRLYGRVQTRLPRFEGKSLKEILSAGITLHDAQYITALEYGFDNWSDLRGLVEGESESLSFPGQADEAVLSEADILSFQQRGYVRVSQAFARDTALRIQDFMWSELERLHDINRDDRSTWPTANPDARWGQRYDLKESRDNPIYSGISSSKLRSAMYQLVGPRSQFQRVGTCSLVSFPEAGSQPWTVQRDFHPEVPFRPGLRVWRPPFLLVFSYVSHVPPQGGSTLVVEDSHRLVVDYSNGLTEVRASEKKLLGRFARSHPWLAELMGKTPDQGDRTRRFMDGAVIDGVEARVVELTGDPGDAVLWHPALLHSRSHNKSGVPKFVLR